MGAKVVLLEGHKMGGDCLNYGCVPSKALIAAGKQAQAMKDRQDIRRDTGGARGEIILPRRIMCRNVIAAIETP